MALRHNNASFKRRGDHMSVNIKPILDQAGMALQRAAANKFGAAVQDFAEQSLGSIFGVNHTAVQNTTQPGEQPSRPQGATFVSTSYAAALAGGTSYRPKLKFLFKIEFIFNPLAVAEFPEIFGGQGSQDFTFMVKAVDRPKIDFEYEDDVNMYNFRTKVLKRIRHRELTITFLDDTGNRVINMFRAMMMLHSPITRRQLQREGTTNPPNNNSILMSNGMVFSPTTEPIDGLDMDNAHRGVVNSQFGQVIDAIRVKQMYVDSSQPLSGASREIIYDFLNARIVSFDLDDLSYDLSEPSIVTMQFDYDWMEIVDVGPLAEMDGPHVAVSLPNSTAPTDMSVLGYGVDGSTESPGAISPFARILGGTAGRIINTISSDAVNRAVKSVAGNGFFGKVVGSYASNAVAGIIGGVTRDIVTGATQVLSNATSPIITGIVGDSGLGQMTRAVGVTRSSPDPLGNFISNLKL